MDIRCPRCAEPWELDTLHDAGAVIHKDYDFMRKLFTRYGCAALEAAYDNRIAEKATCERTASGNVVSALMDIAGDDFDGFASDLEDAEWLGVL